MSNTSTPSTPQDEDTTRISRRDSIKLGAATAVAAGLSQIIGPLVYADTANRGFMVVTATPHECRCDWHFVSSVKTSSYSTWVGQSLKTLPGAGQRKLISA